MTIAQKERLRQRFFRAAGPNTAAFKAMFDAAPGLCLNMKDLKGRFMALNRRNCEVSGIKDEMDVIGLTSADIFPPKYANAYMALDAEVRRTRQPILNRVTEFPTDKSRNFMVSNLYPLIDADGRLIGTAHVYLVTDSADSEGRRFNRLREVADHIAHHYAQNLTVESLATLAGMSSSAFKRAFSSTFNTSPGKYILTTRLNAARERLEKTDKLVADIAQECGFYDQSHFTKVFFRVRGITPGEYRRRHHALP